MAAWLKDQNIAELFPSQGNLGNKDVTTISFLRLSLSFKLYCKRFIIASFASCFLKNSSIRLPDYKYDEILFVQ